MKWKKGLRVIDVWVKQSYIVNLQIYITQTQEHTHALPGYYHSLSKSSFISEAEHRNGRDAVSLTSSVLQQLNEMTLL